MRVYTQLRERVSQAAAAMAVTVAMLGSFAIPYLSAYAADDTGTAGICDPTQSIHMGDSATVGVSDNGVATYVGRDMYIGANNGNDSYNASTGIDKSYAVEAEGLTLVNGKLAVNSAKNSWKGSGFRFGYAGFGAQFRGDSGSDALVVTGQNSAITLSDRNGTDVNALGGWYNASYSRAFLNKNDGSTYYGKINGNTSYAIGTNSSWGSNAERSVYSGANADEVKYGSYTDFSNVNVNGTSTNFNSFYQDNVLGLSKQLSGLASTGSIETEEADTNLYARYKYDYNNGSTIAYGFNNGSGVTLNEKKFTFVGTDNPTMEVFNIKASDLTNGNYDGISFAFENINEKASIVINVTGGDVTFNNGWRFWWNGSEISNGYVTSNVSGNGSSWPYTSVTEETRTAYTTAAQKIMWNFVDAKKVTIKGGANGNGNDDPAAAMLGSIMVPNGSFESHVTTNGRVYVGDDFSMYNPTVASSLTSEGDSASIIDMDQERHNFPWSGSLTASCSAIEWNKVDENGNALGGTTWGVYPSYQDAVDGTNALLEVVDNVENDWNSALGVIQVQPLNPKATYYIKELDTQSGYQLNTNVYAIKTDEDASQLNVDVKYAMAENLFEDPATAASDPSKLLNNDGSIVNKKQGGPLSWTKVDAEDGGTLAGSEWELSKTDENYENPDSLGKITDYTDSSAVLTALDLIGVPTELESDGNETLLSITPTPSDASKAHTFQYSTDGVTWQDTAPTNTVIMRTGDNLVGANYSEANTTVYIRACSTVQTGICSEAKQTTIKPGTLVTSLTVQDADGIEIGSGSTYTVAAGKSVTFSAVAKNNDTTLDGSNISWVKVGPGFTLNAASGSSVTLTTPSDGGSGVVKVTAGSHTVTFLVNAKATTTVYFPASLKGWSAYYIHWGIPGASTWGEKQMTASDDCSGYYTAEIPMSQATTSYQFKVSSTSGWSGSIWPSSTDDDRATFNGTIINTVTSSTSKTTKPETTVPSGCTVTSSAAAAAEASVVAMEYSEESDIAVASDVAESTEYKDSNAKAGGFTIESLPDGNYTLTEITIPDAYDQTKPVKIRVHMKDGKVESWQQYNYATGTWDAKTGNITLANEREKAAATWEKIDGSDNGLIAGSEWTITQTKKWDSTKNDFVDLAAADQKTWTVTDIADAATVCTASDTVKCDVDTAAGKIKVDDLDWGTYTLKESKAPEGYELDTNEYTIAVSKNLLTDTGVGQVKNTRKPGDVEWSKVDSTDASKLLEGSEWEIKQTQTWDSATGTYKDVAEADQKTWTVTDIADESTTCTASDTVKCDVDTAAGKIKVDQLEWGTYTLVETKAPDGYNLGTTTYQFHIKADSLTGATITVADGDGTDPSDNQIPNTPGFQLPKTGGIGTQMYTAIGFAVVVMAVAGLGLSTRTTRARSRR